MRALITGADGFVGRHLVAHLGDAGDEVVASDRRIDGVDLTDPAAVSALVTSVRPEVVFHLGGWSDVGQSWSHPLDALQTNAVGTFAVLAACRDADVDRVLVVTSADVYGSTTADDLPLGEDAPLRPVSPYAASKAAAEMLCVQAHLGWGVSVIRARAFNHLGPGQSVAFAAPAFASRIVEAERTGSADITVGNLSARRDFTDVRDVVRAYRLLVEHAEPGEAYNVCSGIDVSMADIVDQLVALADRPVDLIHDPELDRPVDVPARRGDPTKIFAATPWRPQIALSQALRDVLDDLRQRGSTACPPR